MNTTWMAISLVGSLPLLGCAIAPPAGGAITIPKVVPYASGIGTDAIRKECPFDKDLSIYIERNSSRRTVAIAKDPSVATGKVLTMTITKVHAVAGGRYSGPKFANVDGELRERGQLIGSFKAARRTITANTACGALDNVAKAMGSDIAEWLKAPTMDARLGDEK